MTVTQQQLRLAEIVKEQRANEIEMKELLVLVEEKQRALSRARAVSMRLVIEKQRIEDALDESKILQIKAALAPTASGKSR